MQDKITNSYWNKYVGFFEGPKVLITDKKDKLDEQALPMTTVKRLFGIKLLEVYYRYMGGKYDNFPIGIKFPDKKANPHIKHGIKFKFFQEELDFVIVNKDFKEDEQDNTIKINGEQGEAK